MPLRTFALTIAIAALAVTGAAAQPAADPHAGHHGAAPAEATAGAGADATEAEGWRFNVDSVVFAGYNYQRREFTDFYAFESQNWFMAAAQRKQGATSVTLLSMFSLEPFTLQDLGSPQVFQTGETYQGAPLIDYQHPHDLVMALGGRVERASRGVRGLFEASLVGSPALGPPPFMHRPSAADNPQVPLSHHGLDSTHVSSSVFTGGAEWRGLELEASWFHGKEPDENRLDLDVGAPDSWAARLSWASGPWHLQASGGRLKQPEWVHPYDETRLTASIGYDAVWGRRPVSLLAAWGEKREAFGVFDNYLFESHVAIAERDAVFTRVELVTKAILGGGLHLPGVQHYHPHSRIGALSAGYVRDVISRAYGRIGVGADITVYRVPPNLEANYGQPLSFHAFLRYAAPRAETHVHH